MNLLNDFKVEQKVDHHQWGEGLVVRKTKHKILIKFKYPLPASYNCGCQFVYCLPEELEVIE